jgi:hypothetical protein
MQSFTRRSFGRGLAAAVILLFTFGAGTADAKKKSRSKLSKEARLIDFDTEAGTMTVKEKGKKVVYNVKFEGSLMTRTMFTIEAKRVEATRIPLKAKVNIYWIRDEQDPKKRFARKVDALKIPKELLDDN